MIETNTGIHTTPSAQLSSGFTRLVASFTSMVHRFRANKTRRAQNSTGAQFTTSKSSASDLSTNKSADYFEEPTTMTVEKAYRTPSTLRSDSLPVRITLLFSILFVCIGLYLIDSIFGLWLYELPLEDLRRAAHMVYESGTAEGLSEGAALVMSEENAAYLRNTLYRTYLVRVSWGLGLALALVLATGIYLRSYTQRNTRALLDFAQQIGESNWNAELDGSLNGEFRHLGESMVVMRRQLAAYERQRTAMLDRVTHDVRSPLTVIRSLASMQSTMSVDGSPTANHATGKPSVGSLSGRDMGTHNWALADACAIQMGRLLDDLGYLAGNDSSRAYQPTPNASTDLVSSIHEIVAYYEAKFRNQKIKFDKPQPATELPPIAMEFTRFSQIIGNLLDNAIAHGQAKRISITVARKVPGNLTLFITDNGCGMTDPIQSRIFEAGFSTGDSSSAHQGLGMAIVTEIVQAHGGTIQVQSRPGEGTTFEIMVPTIEISYL